MCIQNAISNQFNSVQWCHLIISLLLRWRVYPRDHRLILVSVNHWFTRLRHLKIQTKWTYHLTYNWLQLSIYLIYSPKHISILKYDSKLSKYSCKRAATFASTVVENANTSFITGNLIFHTQMHFFSGLTFRCSSNWSVRLVKNSNASCCSLILTGCPHSLKTFQKCSGS